MTVNKLICSIITLCGMMLCALPVHANRVALIIGNANYQNEPSLRNPVNDARLIGKMLKDNLHFDDVVIKENVKTDELDRLLDQFGEKAKGADAVVFYFSGHGMQDEGKRNYLLPVDAHINNLAELRRKTMPADEVMSRLNDAHARVTLVILDACRDNPFAATRGGTKGLSRITADGISDGMLVAYATKEGQTAEDGNGKNSPYAEALVRSLGKGDKPILLALDDVRQSVKDATGGKQQPTRYGDLPASVYLTSPFSMGASGNSSAPSATDLASIEKQVWAAAEQANTAAAYQEYISGYPTGVYIRLAKIKLSALSTTPTAAVQTAPVRTNSANVSTASTATSSGTFRDCEDGSCPDMIVIPSGSFTMGSPSSESGRSDSEGPQHQVNVSTFAMGKTAVTQGQWKAMMGSNPSYSTNCGDNCPVENVSWNEAKDFIQRLNQKTGKTYRLPSEAEWEYACRAGGQHLYCGGDNVDAVAWTNQNSGKTTHPVATKQANAWGLYDMSGNVAQMVEDCYYHNYTGAQTKPAMLALFTLSNINNNRYADYTDAPTNGSAWTTGTCDVGRRVLRGGTWKDRPQFARSALRSWYSPTGRDSGIGFRVARMLP